jgi:hypothetical protein
MFTFAPIAMHMLQRMQSGGNERHAASVGRSRARRAEEEGAETLFLCERRRSRRIHARDARAASSKYVRSRQM